MGLLAFCKKSRAPAQRDPDPRQEWGICWQKTESGAQQVAAASLVGRGELHLCPEGTGLLQMAAGRIFCLGGQPVSPYPLAGANRSAGARGLNSQI